MDSDHTLEGLSSVSHKPKLRLKQSVNLQKLINEGEVVFDKDDSDDEIEELEDFHEDDDGQLESPFVDANAKSMLATHFVVKRNEAPNPEVTSDAIEAVLSSESVSLPSKSFDPKQPMTEEELEHERLLQKKVLKAGNGQKIPDGSVVLYHYILFVKGSESDGPFDNSVRLDSPPICDLKNPNVLPGVYLAILGMEVGEVSKFLFGPNLAFGELGIPPAVPKNANILCYLEILELVDDRSLKKSPLCMTAQERASMPVENIIDCADQLKLEGNEQYEREKFENAMKKYRKAILILEEYPLWKEDDQEKLAPVLSTMYSNLAQSYLKLGKPQQAIIACKLGIRAANGKEDVKVLYRYAKGEFALHKYEDAIRICERGLVLEPDNLDLKCLRLKINVELDRQKESITNMFKGILNP